MRALRLRASAAVPAVALAALAGGCSVKGSDNANLIVGKQVFVAKCGSCHVLARANTRGIVGPNLDEAFRQSIAEGLRRTTIRGVVEGQVHNPNPIGAMPKDLVGGAKLSDVASYVASVAALPGQDSGLLATAVAPAGAGKPAVEKAGKLSIEASPTSHHLSYHPSPLSSSIFRPEDGDRIIEPGRPPPGRRAGRARHAGGGTPWSPRW